MIVAFGTSTPDLDHRRRDEHVDLARLEGRHDRAALGRLQPAVHAADAEAVQLGGRSRSASSSAARAIVVSEPSISGQTTYAWRPSSRCRRSRSYASALRSSADPGGDDRLAVGGRRRDLRDGEVAVDRQRERPRDRRRRHVEDVRAPALGERRPLLDAEAVLLVDDGDGEVAEVDLALDQRMRADGDADVAGGDQLVDGAPLARAEARREQRDAHAELARRGPRS